MGTLVSAGTTNRPLGFRKLRVSSQTNPRSRSHERARFWNGFDVAAPTVPKHPISTDRVRSSCETQRLLVSLVVFDLLRYSLVLFAQDSRIKSAWLIPAGRPRLQLRSPPSPPTPLLCLALPEAVVIAPDKSTTSIL